jgi:hypothetical protein
MKGIHQGILTAILHIETTAANKHTLAEHSRTSGQNLRKAMPDALR